MAAGVAWESPPKMRVRIPTGRSLSATAWERRHRGILVVLAVHAVGLTAFGILRGFALQHALLEGGAIAFLAFVAALPSVARRARSVVASAGLMSCSAVLVHLSGGYIEAHFHFFVMLGIVFLYEDWMPYVLAVAYVALHHGIVGTLDPASVFNHPDAFAEPWLWASIHAVFILGLSAALLVAWNAIESAREAETRALAEAEGAKRHLHAQEKMAALGSLVAGLAHEVRTPLTIISTNASLIEMAADRHLDETPLARQVLPPVSEIQSAVDRVNALVLQLRKFHRLSPDDMQVAPLDRTVADAIRLFATAHRAARPVSTTLEPTGDVRLDALGIHQLVLNLLANALDAIDPASGTIRVRTLRDGAHAVLVVEDDGVGMSEDTLRIAFEPLFTTKKEGMGLGLHIVRRIVDAHDASLHVHSQLGRGTRFELRFPLARIVPVTAEAPQVPTAHA